MRLWLIGLGLAIMSSALGLPNAAFAQGLRFATDSRAPLEVEAGLMVWQRIVAKARLTDNAKITQGPLMLSADKLEINFTADGTAQDIFAEGHVVLVSAGDGESTPRRAQSAQAHVDLTRQTIALIGNVSMVEGNENKTQLNGARLALDMVSGRARLSGAGDKPRARIELR